MLRRMWATTVLMLAVVGFPGFAQGAPKAGQHYSWKISFRGELLGDKEAPLGSGASITGEWRETVVAVRADGFEVRYELSDVRMIGSDRRHVDAKALNEAQ